MKSSSQAAGERRKSLSEVVKMKKAIGGIRVKAKAGAGVLHALPVLNTPAAESVTTTAAAIAAADKELRGFTVQQAATVPAAALEEEFKRGFDAGRISGAENAKRELEGRISEDGVALGNLLENVGEQLKILYGRIEEEAFRLAIDVAEKLVKRTVTLDDEFVVRQIKDAIHRVVGVESIKIRVNPFDEPLVREHRASILSSVDSIRECVIEPDENIGRGDCIIESASGNIDARMSTQLRQIEAALFNEQATGGRG